MDYIESLSINSDYIAGANKDNFHITGIVPKKDFSYIIDIVDLILGQRN